MIRRTFLKESELTLAIRQWHRHRRVQSRDGVLLGVGGKELIMERTYTDTGMGITTIREAWILLTVQVVLGMNVAAFHVARTHDYWTAAIAVIWTVGVAIATIRTLRELAGLDPGEPATRIAFRLAALQPIVGISPVILLLLP
jgi:hypothetical protein